MLNSARSLDDLRSPPSNRLEALADHLGVPVQRINELVRGKRGVTTETAWLLAQAFGTTPEFWMNLQMQYELTSTKPPKHIKRLVA